MLRKELAESGGEKFTVVITLHVLDGYVKLWENTNDEEIECRASVVFMT